jgi:hypothetical protein
VGKVDFLLARDMLVAPHHAVIGMTKALLPQLRRNSRFLM